MTFTPCGKLPNTAVSLTTKILISHVQLVSFSLYPQGVWVWTTAEKWEFPHLHRAKASFSKIKNKSRNVRGADNGSWIFFSHKEMRVWGSRWGSNVGLLLIFTGHVFWKRRQTKNTKSLTFPNSKLHTQWVLKWKESPRPWEAVFRICAF